MKMKTKLLLRALSLTFTLAVVGMLSAESNFCSEAVAQVVAPQDAELWKQLDITEDGWLSGTELQDGTWLKYDTDGDKEVTKDEFMAGRAKEKNKTNAAPVGKKIVEQSVPRKPGYIVGRCTDSAGKPLRSVRIRVFGTTEAGENTNYETKTDANGLYSVRLPNGNFHVGWALFDVAAPAGPAYSLPLHPLDGSNDDAESTPGIVENFVLKISGRISPLKDAQNELSYYGGSISVSGGAIANAGLFDDSYYRFPEGSSLELTLVPQGELADGSTGETLVRRKSVKEGTSFLDIPIGRYEVTVNLIGADGASKPLRVAAARVGLGTSPIRFTPKPEDFGQSATIYFPSNGDSIPVLSLPGASYADVSVQP